MPYIRGRELYILLKQKKHFDESTVKFYSAQVAIAIAYLHENGITHRDLKLENILVDERGYLKIIDYGLSKIMDDGINSYF